MKFLDSLEKRFGHLAVPNVVMVLIVAQLFIYAAIIVGRLELVSIVLIPKAVIAGEWWRLLSFLMAPPYLAGSLLQALFLAFFWYILYFMSHALESAWGVFRFNIYLLTAIVFAVVGAFVGQVISPGSLVFVSTSFLYYCVFFAFATLHPNIQFLMFFIIPMKVKWLAWIIFAGGALYFLAMSSIGQRIAFAAPFLCYVLFFKDALAQSMEAKKRRAAFEAERRDAVGAALHTCSECGASDKTHPDRDFRYKTVDGDAICICEECRNS
ncbi:hypothetical protein DDZ13_08670 [Coraliomargarita sinensis]|uniref:Peptidase S54 rhomboid domain-containing protein n=1 Tax=Coraliomargarita sinensis TaxID=2174842 RepID=A0A317ZL56_9BACT|nr:rhomboid family intramembrane serine protease [Coraliomargarita sinensis]PXA04101.1 hypothetical protein DDZ13_08670 [Coraliomargarita sinensis]